MVGRGETIANELATSPWIAIDACGRVDCSAAPLLAEAVDAASMVGREVDIDDTRSINDPIPILAPISTGGVLNPIANEGFACTSITVVGAEVARMIAPAVSISTSEAIDGVDVSMKIPPPEDGKSSSAAVAGDGADISTSALNAIPASMAIAGDGGDIGSTTDELTPDSIDSVGDGSAMAGLTWANASISMLVEGLGVAAVMAAADCTLLVMEVDVDEAVITAAALALVPAGN